jgi:hypothetical protein
VLALEDLWVLAELYYWRTPDQVDPGRNDQVEELFRTVGIKQGREYLAALSRVHPGARDEEPLPAIAVANHPGALPEASIDVFDSRLAYFWRPLAFEEGLHTLQQLGYTHLLSTNPGKSGPGPYWNFNTALYQAMDDGSIGYRLKKAGSFRAAGLDVEIDELPKEDTQ